MKATHIALLAALIIGLGTPAQAADKREKKPKTETTKPAQEKKKSKGFLFWKKKEAPAPHQAPAEEKPSIDRPGLFRVTKEKDDWFFFIPDSLLGREFFTTTRFTATPAGISNYGGEMLTSQTVFFEKAPGKRMLLRSHLLVSKADSTQMINRAVQVSDACPILNSFEIVESKGGTSKIKVTSYFAGEAAGLGFSQNQRQEFGLIGLHGDKSYIEDIQSFPLNTEVRMVKTYGSNGRTAPASRSTGLATFGLNISFIALPEKPMPVRHFDRRVGYFNHGFTQFDDNTQRVLPQSYIARFRLEARPEDVERQKRGEAVEPIKPIIYYIDPATPKQWRKYLIQGVNDWQVAFEKAGWKDAIIGMEWPENDTTMSMEDARYNCIRYLASPIENAYGPHVSDPRTGEILEAHVCWYHNVLSLVHNWYFIQATSIDEAARKMHYDEELMGQLIRFVSSHEIGHSLGLRHNFGASSTVPVDSLRNKDWVERHGHTPSIMDYARFNYVAQPEDQISRLGIFPRINDYDIWAIQWGYSPMAGNDPYEDHAQREQWVAQKLQDKRLWWGDGESSIGGLDPRNQTEDLGDDAMKASSYGILNLKRQLCELPHWTTDNDKDIYNQDLSRMFDEVVTQLRRYNGHVARNIGGFFINFQPKGSQADWFAPVPRDRQKAALEWMEQNVLEEPTWVREVPYARSLHYNPITLTHGIARTGINQLTSRLYYMNENYSAEEYVSDLVNMVFKEAAQNKAVSPYRTTLQIQLTENLIGVFNDDSNQTRAAALLGLKTIQAKAAQARTTTPDSKSRAHWASLYDKVSRILDWK